MTNRTVEEQTKMIKGMVEKNKDIFELETWKQEEYIRLVWNDKLSDRLEEIKF